MGPTKRIVVLGGLVMDLIFEVPEWPALRKAVQASQFVMQPGGKGLNQAIAASRLGAQVSVICNVGQDHLGDLLLTELEKEGVDYQFVERHLAADTDATAVIIENSEPGFIGAKLATQTVTPGNVRKAEVYIKSADVVMATGEIPLESVRVAFEIAKKHGVTTILNPAPPEQINQSILSIADYIVPNLWEASVVVGETRGGLVSIETIAKKLRRAGAKDVIITTGEAGCWALIDEEFKEFHPFSIEVVDTTGASDAFCSALAIAKTQGINIDDAITIAMAAAALSCTKFGASSSMPKKSELNDFLKRNDSSIQIK